MIPDWLRSLRERLDADLPEWFIEHAPPSDPHRSSAVLVLFGPDADGETSIVLTERAHDLRSHAAQAVFPGGHVDLGETPIQAALRESTEEIGLDPHSVEIVCCLPGVYLTPASTEYVPVLGWWHAPHPIDVVDPAEVRRVVVPTVADLIDARNRSTARAPGGYAGPGFLVDDLSVWGVTADLLQVVLDLAGLSQPWDASVSHPLPDRRSRRTRWTLSRSLRRRSLREGASPRWPHSADLSGRLRPRIDRITGKPPRGIPPVLGEAGLDLEVS